MSAVVDSAWGAIIGFAADPATKPIADLAKQAISDGTRNGAFAVAGFLVLGFLSTLSLARSHKEEDEHAPKTAAS